MRKMTVTERTMLELFTGIGLSGLFFQLVGLALPCARVRYAVGLWIGILCAFFFSMHMCRSTVRALESDERTAVRVMTASYLTRYLLTGVALVLVWYTDIGYPLACFLGVMGLKAAAYMQPLLHKFYNAVFHETDPIPEPLPDEDGAAFEDAEK